MTVLLLRLDTVIQLRDFVEDRLCFDHRTGTVAGHSRVGTSMKSVVVVCDLTKKYKMNQCKVDLARKKKKLGPCHYSVMKSLHLLPSKNSGANFHKTENSRVYSVCCKHGTHKSCTTAVFRKLESCV